MYNVMIFVNCDYRTISKNVLFHRLQRHFEVQSQTSLSRGELFKAYIIHCERNNITHCNPATFGKILRSVFPGVKTRRIGTRGNSRSDDL